MTTRPANPKPRRSGKKPGKVKASEVDPLALELFGVIQMALAGHGLPPRHQRRLFEQAQRSRSVKRVSDSMLDDYRALGDLLTRWREEAPYVDESGKPRVLEIAGSGATFEQLCRVFLPEKSLKEAVAFASRMAQVGIRPGGRIALLGDTMVNLSRDPAGALALLISHIRRIFETCLHNVQRAEDSALLGRLERLVGQVIDAEAFDAFQQAIRPPLHDLCERADQLLSASAKPGSRSVSPRGMGGLGMYLYFDGKMKKVRSRRGGPNR